MKKMRRVVSALAVLAMLFTTFSCSSPETPENPKSEKEKDDAGKTDEPGSSDKPAQGSIVIDEGTSDASEEVGIKLTITVPANSSSLAIFRWDITENPNGFVGREIYETKNESNTAKTITFYDKYGITKDHSYKYATANNWGSRTEWGEAVKAKADGWELPELKTAPKASFENISLTYTQVPLVQFKNSENYDYAFSPAYLFKTPWWMVEGAKESDGDFVDWDYGLWFGYNTEHPNDKSFGIGEDHRGLLLTLNDYNLTVFVDKEKNLNYVAYYEADAFDFPQKIYAENKVVEEGNDLVFTIPVPAGTHNVSLMKYDEKLGDYFEIASKPYPDEAPNERRTEIKLKDLYEHEKGKEGKYFIAYDGWKRYDGYDYDKNQGGGISYTPKEMRRKQPVISDIKVVFDGSNIRLTKAPKIENVTINEETNYWFILDYLDAENPNNEDGRVSVWFDRGACEDSEKKTVEHDVTDMQKNLTNGQKLALRTLRLNYTIEENGLMWDVHYNVPFAELDVPANLTINKEINTSDIKAENEISMSISFPERLAEINILRREVDNDGKPVTDYEQIGWQGPKVNDKEHFEIAQTKTFVDRYTVQEGHYYEYKAEFIDEDWNYKGQQNLGIHLAGKDGYPKPVFSESNYPEIIVEYTDEGPLFKITNEDALNSMNYSTGATPYWISLNLWYTNGISDFYPWLGSYGTEFRTYQISKDEWLAAGTGVYSLQSFCINDQFQGDYFDRQFWYDIEELDADKIVDALYQSPVEMENGGFEMEIELPYNHHWKQVEKIRNVTIQCREKPATDSYNWPVDDPDTSIIKGDLGDWSEKLKSSGKLNFKDYFGFEKGKTYQYRAIIKVNDWEALEFSLCEVTPTKDSYAYPTFKNDVKPALSWDSETETLSVTNNPELILPSGLPDIEWWQIELGYSNVKNDGSGFWPFFNRYPESDKDFKADNLGSSYTLNADYYRITLCLKGEDIIPNIFLPLDDLGTAKTLTRQ